MPIHRPIGKRSSIPKDTIMKKLLLPLVLIAALSESLWAGSFIEEHYIYCGAILELGPVGYPTWNQASIVRPPEHGRVFIFTDDPFPDSLVYKSDYGYLGVDTFVVECAHATQITCDTGIYIIHVIGCPPIFAFTETHEITCDSTLLAPELGYPFWVVPEIIQEPSNGQAAILNLSSLDRDTLQYIPNPGFSGKDTVIVYCAHATQVTCETGIFIINVSCTNQSRESKPGLGLRFFPNPVDDVLFVECPNSIERLLVTTATGLPIREIQLPVPSRSVEVDLKGLPPAWYVLTAWSGDAFESFGFVVMP